MKEVLFFLIVFILASGTRIITGHKQVPAINEIQKIEETVALPKSIIISSLGINTNIEEVGLDNEGLMDIPKDVNNVGWYKYGPKPGTAGSSVIDGHLDSKLGPAIFYKLYSLNTGDIIQIIDKNNKTYEFVVTDKKVFKNDQFPVNEVFAANNEKGLNLITCYGTYSKKTLTYDERLVIYAKLKS